MVKKKVDFSILMIFIVAVVAVTAIIALIVSVNSGPQLFMDEEGNVLIGYAKGGIKGKPSGSEKECTDSDGGINYFVMGQTSGPKPKGFKPSDACLDSNLLREVYCENNMAASVQYLCLNGCLDGACIKVLPVCGNGIVDLGEECDGGVGGASCVDFGFDGGLLYCAPDCAFDTSQCTYGPVCGNGIVEQGEQCDVSNFNGMICDDFGNFTGGNLVCTSQCTFDFSQCISVFCGDNICHSQYGENFENCDYDCQPNPNQAYLHMSPRTTYAQVGEIIKVNIFVENIVDFFGFQFDVNYNPSILEFYSTQQGEFFTNNGQAQTFCLDPGITSSGLLDNVACTRLGGTSFSGSGVIYSLYFRTLAAGTSSIVFSNVKLANPSANDIYATIINSQAVVR